MGTQRQQQTYVVPFYTCSLLDSQKVCWLELWLTANRGENGWCVECSHTNITSYCNSFHYFHYESCPKWRYQVCYVVNSGTLFNGISWFVRLLHIPVNTEHQTYLGFQLKGRKFVSDKDCAMNGLLYLLLTITSIYTTLNSYKISNQ